MLGTGVEAAAAAVLEQRMQSMVINAGVNVADLDSNQLETSDVVRFEREFLHAAAASFLLEADAVESFDGTFPCLQTLSNIAHGHSLYSSQIQIGTVHPYMMRWLHCKSQHLVCKELAGLACSCSSHGATFVGIHPMTPLGFDVITMPAKFDIGVSLSGDQVVVLITIHKHT